MALEAMKLDDFLKVKLLTQHDLHVKIQDVAEDVLRASASPSPDDPNRPRIISAADLVRRMKPFLVYN